MKTVKELQLKTTDITDIIPTIIRQQFIEEGRPARVFKQLLIFNDDLTRRPGTEINLPKIGSISASRVGEGEEITTFKKATVSKVTATPFKVGVAVKFTQESLDAESIGILNAHIKEASEALATIENTEIMWELNGRRPVYTLSGGSWSVAPNEDSFGGVLGTVTVSLTTKPVLKVDSIVGSVSGTLTSGTDYKVDYYDGKVQFLGISATQTMTVKYWDTSRTQYVDASTKGKLSYADILQARLKVLTSKRKPDTLVVHEDEAADLLTDSKFIDASQYGSNRPILEGEIGRIAGLRVIPSTEQFAGVALVMDSSVAGWYVLKRDVDVKRKQYEEADSIALFFYMEFTPKVTNDEAIALVVNAQSDAADL